MPDPTHRLSQRHYALTLQVPKPADDATPELTEVIDEVAVALDEYVMSEDISADVDIEFITRPGLVDLISTIRDGYTLSVVVEGPTIDASLILNAIASDLVDMYDEMDVEYTDDIDDFLIYFDLDSSESISTPVKKRPKRKKPKKTKLEETETQLPLIFPPEIEESK